MAIRSRILQRALLNLALLVVLGVLLAVVYLRPGAHTEFENQALTELDPQTVRRIVLERPDQPRLVLERRDHEWRLREPIQVVADATRVGELLAVLEQKSFSRYPSSGIDMTKLGLDAPLMTAHFDEVQLSIGATNPIGHRRYVLLADQVHLIADTVSHLLQTDAAAFASRRLLSTTSPVAKLILPSLLLTKAPHGWQADPAQPAVPQQAWQELVNAWTDATATSAEPPTAGHATSRHVDIHFEDGDSVRFDIVAREPILILARPDLGIHYRLAPAMASRLLSPRPQTQKSQ